MRTAEERLALLHKRAADLRKEKELTGLRALGGASGGLALCLLSLLAIFGQNSHGMAEIGYAATSLLSENAGGYVLTAVIAFALGVVVTLLLRRGKSRDRPNRVDK